MNIDYVSPLIWTLLLIILVILTCINLESAVNMFSYITSLLL